MLLKVVAAHRVSDIFGPIVYTNYGKINADGSITYDSQQEAYNAFFKDLDEAQVKLRPYARSADSVRKFRAFDLVYNGDYTKWMKLINSVRLRLAVRLSKADPTKAKTEAEKSLADEFGVLENIDEDFIINSESLNNPISVISGAGVISKWGHPLKATW